MAMGLSATSPAQKLTFLLVFFADREKGATSVLGPQPIIWLLPSSPSGQAILLGLLDVTQVRLLLIQTAVIPLPSSQWDITWHCGYRKLQLQCPGLVIIQLRKHAWPQGHHLVKARTILVQTHTVQQSRLEAVRPPVSAGPPSGEPAES